MTRYYIIKTNVKSLSPLYISFLLSVIFPPAYTHHPDMMTVPSTELTTGMAVMTPLKEGREAAALHGPEVHRSVSWDNRDSV
jgi:hypothetical protein